MLDRLHSLAQRYGFLMMAREGTHLDDDTRKLLVLEHLSCPGIFWFCWVSALLCRTHMALHRTHWDYISLCETKETAFVKADASGLNCLSDFLSTLCSNWTTNSLFFIFPSLQGLWQKDRHTLFSRFDTITWQLNRRFAVYSLIQRNCTIESIHYFCLPFDEHVLLPLQLYWQRDYEDGQISSLRVCLRVLSLKGEKV